MVKKKSPPPAQSPPKHASPGRQKKAAKDEKLGLNIGVVVSIGLLIGILGYWYSMPRRNEYNLEDDEGGFQAVKKWIIEEHGGTVSPNVEQSYGPDPTNTLRGLLKKNIKTDF